MAERHLAVGEVVQVARGFLEIGIKLLQVDRVSASIPL
jgi:hypothetical protein